MTDAPPIEHIAILGSGTMGAGIAQSCLQSGYSVILFDIADAMLEKAQQSIEQGLEKAVQKNKLSPEDKATALSKLHLMTDISEAVSDADLMIEAAPENLTLKQTLFADVYKNCQKSAAIFTSNTSSIAITAIGYQCPHPSQFAGLHFFNPVPLMPLVEIIRSANTSDDTVKTLERFVGSLNKTSVTVKDTPGFIVNRVARPFYGEALKILGEYGESEALVSSIDAVMKQAGGFKMGPFELMDLIGIDVNFAVTQSVYNAYFQEPRYQPSPIQQAKVHAGHLGRKTKKGFYDHV